MGKVKIRNHEFSMSNIARIVHYAPFETLFFLGAPKEKRHLVICLGVGIVKVIQKGDDCDLVGMDFGAGFYREIFVFSNHARRQIYTMKKGQYAWFYGMLRTYTDKEDGKIKTCLYAKAFQGWYVPKNFDIKKIDPNELDKLTEENESKINFIDEILKGQEE